MKKLSYPTDLANELLPEDFPGVPIPAKSVLEELLDICFHASCLSEEGQRLEFRVALWSREAHAAENRHYTSGGERACFQLEKPIELSTQALRRLTPAHDPATAFLAVEATEEGRLKIWAIGFTDREWWKSGSAGMPRDRHPDPDALVVRVSSPGVLAVCYERRTLCSLQLGTVYPKVGDILGISTHEAFFRRAIERLAKSLELGDSGMRGPDSFMQVKRIYFEALRTMLSRARERSHGAMFLILPTQVPGSAHLKSLSIKHAVLDTSIEVSLAAACRSYLATEMATTEYCRSILAKAFTVDPPDLLLVENYIAEKSGRASHEERLRRKLESVGDLGCIDGAVVLTDGLQLLGFGAEIQVEVPMTHVIKFVGNNSKGSLDDIENHGTRHRSAFRFCHKHPDATAFVLPQDGGISVVRWHGDAVGFWKAAE